MNEISLTKCSLIRLHVFLNMGLKLKTHQRDTTDLWLEKSKCLLTSSPQTINKHNYYLMCLEQIPVVQLSRVELTIKNILIVFTTIQKENKVLIYNTIGFSST